jgi:hypothetical protein
MASSLPIPHSTSSSTLLYKVDPSTVAASFDVDITQLSLSDFYRYFNSYALFLQSTEYKDQVEYDEGPGRCFAAALFYLLHHKNYDKDKALQVLEVQVQRQREESIRRVVRCKRCRHALFRQGTQQNREGRRITPFV